MLALGDLAALERRMWIGVQRRKGKAGDTVFYLPFKSTVTIGFVTSLHSNMSA